MKRLLLLLLAGCSSEQAPNHDPTFTMQMTIGAGMETTQCQFVKMPPGHSYVIAADHEYTPGSHHMLLYRTDLTKIDNPNIQDCYEGSIMSHVRGVLYGSQEAKGSMMLPDGVGYEVQSEEVLLLQTHYLNASASSLSSKVTVTLHTISDASKIQNLAGVLFFYNPFIDVPAGSMATAAARCTLGKDITLMGAFPHYHARGIGYRAYLDTAGQTATDPFYTSTDWTHPAPFTGGPMKIAAGSAIRWYCDYDNTNGANDYFQGPSAATNEMCMFTGGYYPAASPGFEMCVTDMNGFGVGDQTCSQALDCIKACPPGNAPDFGNAMANVDPCWQKCFTSACPKGSDQLVDELSCIGANCNTECSSGDQSACNSCAQAHCLSQSLACLGGTC
jgi:hypothetical protein